MGAHFQVAPWAGTLKVTSAIGTIVIGVAAFIVYRVIVMPTGLPHVLALAIALSFPAIAAVSFLFMVTGYDVAEGDLYVQRPLWSTRIALTRLAKAWHEPTACRGSLRIFGNGGLYSFTGLYQNRTLGRFRLFGTDLKRAVVLNLERRVVVVTPADPDAFVAYLEQLFPAVRPGPGDVQAARDAEVRRERW
jgi:hypothetical protein